jgi:hypothetical protein
MDKKKSGKKKKSFFFALIVRLHLVHGMEWGEKRKQEKKKQRTQPPTMPLDTDRWVWHWPSNWSRRHQEQSECWSVLMTFLLFLFFAWLLWMLWKSASTRRPNRMQLPQLEQGVQGQRLGPNAAFPDIVRSFQNTQLSPEMQTILSPANWNKWQQISKGVWLYPKSGDPNRYWQIGFSSAQSRWILVDPHYYRREHSYEHNNSDRNYKEHGFWGYHDDGNKYYYGDWDRDSRRH